MTQFLIESDIRRTRFILEAKDATDAVARSVLKEGAEYTLYLELNEASVNDVIRKINDGVRKLPKAFASKITQKLKALPRTALPMAAAAIIAATSGAAAQTSDSSTMNALAAQLDSIAQNIQTLKTDSNSEFKKQTDKYVTAKWTEKDDREIQTYYNYLRDNAFDDAKFAYWIKSTRGYLDDRSRAGTPNAEHWKKQIDSLERWHADGFDMHLMKVIKLQMVSDPESAIKTVTDKGLENTTTGQNIIKAAKKKLGNN